MELAEENGNRNEKLFYAVLKEETPVPLSDLEKMKSIPVEVFNSGLKSERIYASNVLGIVEGSDDSLKNEYVLISAHYDHVGVGKQGGGPYSPQDSIFNGARDNGMGTVALLAAAKSLASHPPKRSVILLACTGEEMGLIGSAYYADHPVIPMDQTVFNLNNDGAGYNTTEAFTVIGFDKTNVTSELETAADVFNFDISKDPAPEQNLYERSDNISFARKGVPAIDFAPGVAAMDEKIFQYYHQVTDDPESIDYEYLLRFCKVFSHTARLIADKMDKPEWAPGVSYGRD